MWGLFSVVLEMVVCVSCLAQLKRSNEERLTCCRFRKNVKVFVWSAGQFLFLVSLRK